MNRNIVITQDLKFSEKQIRKLSQFGEVEVYKNQPGSFNDWYERCKNADIICSGIYGLNSTRLYDLDDVFISVPFVGVEFINISKLKKKKIVIANSPGCNKEAVVEWIVGMMLMYFRRLRQLANTEKQNITEVLKSAIGLYNKSITILGAGNIGSHLGKVCECLGMRVSYFRRGDNLIQTTKGSDIIVNCLSVNQSTLGLLDKDFFNSLKNVALFISASRHQTYDIDALKKALDNDIICHAIDDAANAESGDVNDTEYKKLLNNPKMIATPHISWNTDSEKEIAIDMAIENIKAWINGNPINLIY